MKKKKSNKIWEDCDDCAICRAMKDGTASTFEGLKKAFDEANKTGEGMVGFNPDFFQNMKGGRMAMRTPNKNDLYYDAMDAVDVKDYVNAEKFLKQALDLDPDCVQTYIGFTNLYADMKENEKARENIKIAFEKTKKKFPKWPKSMPWGILENREYLRAMQYMADLYADDKREAEAIELYRLVLKLNPNDNSGTRYVLAGLYAGINGKQINKMFDEGNRTQNWSKLEKLVSEQNKKHNFWKEPKD